MGITILCSGRGDCQAGKWERDCSHEPWAKLIVIRRGIAPEYGIARDGSDPVLHPLRPGRIHLIPGDCRHVHRCHAPFSLDWCHFTVDDPQAAARLNRLDAPVSWQLADTVPVDLREDVVAHAHLSPAGQLFAAGLVLQLLGRLPSPPEGADMDLRMRLSPAISWIQYNFQRPQSVPALARLVGLRPSRFQQLFREVHGTSVYAHVMGLRLAMAQRLLASTTEPVQAIAAQVGYANAFLFSRLFTKHLGMSPTAYRAQARAG